VDGASWLPAHAAAVAVTPEHLRAYVLPVSGCAAGGAVAVGVLRVEVADVLERVPVAACGRSAADGERCERASAVDADREHNYESPSSRRMPSMIAWSRTACAVARLRP
jgi:hypothetical protein